MTTKTKELWTKISALRKKTTVHSNFFLFPQELEKMLQEKDTVVSEEENAVIVLEKTEAFYRLYYCASTLEGLIHSTQGFPWKMNAIPVVVDVVGHPDTEKAVISGLEKAGFRRIETLRYMRLRSDYFSSFHDFGEVMWAKGDDALEIERLLYKTFNIYVSRLPTRSEIEALISQGTVLIYPQGQHIAGLAIFKPIGRTQLLLDQLAVYGDHRGLGIGCKLLQTGCVRFGVGRNTVLWSLGNAVDFYEKCGFEKGKRVDYVLVKEG